MLEQREGWGWGVGQEAWVWAGAEERGSPAPLALCWQVENLKERLISQAQEVSRLRSELVRPITHPTWGGGRPIHPVQTGPST